MNGFNLLARIALAILLAASMGVEADSADRIGAEAQEKGIKARSGTGRYIVMLDEAPLVERLAKGLPNSGQSVTVAPERLPGGKLNLKSAVAERHLQSIDADFAEFRSNAEAMLGRELAPVHRYRVAINGFSARLSDKEAQRLAKMDGVRYIRRDEHFKLETDAGPGWIGADRIWAGEGFVPATLGEGVVVGVIDSGINFTHPSFDDPGEGQQVDTGIHDFENPYGMQLGLCSDSEVPCNDKLVGVYDFVEDDPDTEVVEEFNNGEDNGAHGAHTASTAAGNPISFTLINGAPLNLSGVAPEANIISYRVCYAGDPADPDDDACQGSAILAAIDQAILDDVDVINYSVGGGAFDPWSAPDTLAFLNAVEAGIFVATSAGNSGPGLGTMGRPANAPWITAVGSATHDRVFASILKATEGGATIPPGDLVGESFTLEDISQSPIVHAKDFGNALCGTGAAELAPSCDGNTGASNPFPPGTFNGEIVVCDRGTYGRVEKGKNLLLAGAGGYVLANTDSAGQESTEADQHCLPATHLGEQDGNVLRGWLDSGENHLASMTGFLLFSSEAKADQMSGFSSRGPNPEPAEDVLKPNLIAPGDLIFAADNESNGIIGLGGTSMASPHVAGAAALLLANEPSLTPAQIASVLELTATDELAKNTNGGPATHFDTGAGRPRLFEAATAGIYLEETPTAFRSADPFIGGEPGNLNLASLTNADCGASCTFTRQIGSFVNGRTWNVTSSGFPAGVVVTTNPSSFTILNDTPQTLEITVDLSEANATGQWVYGKIHIDNNNFPTATLPTSVFATAGELPDEWVITSDQSAGFQDEPVGGLIGLPQATFSSGGFVEPLVTTVELVEDPTFDDAFDGSEGVFTLLYSVEEGALWLHADTPSSPAEDLDLFVGFDANGDGQAQESEVVCTSATFDDIENCEIYQPDAGVWWILVQNWEDGVENGSGPAQEIDLVSWLVMADAASDLVVTGPGITEAQDQFDVRLAWDDINIAGGEEVYGAVRIGSSAANAGNIGVVPVRFVRTGIAVPGTTALIDGRQEKFALGAGDTHEGMYIDIPPGVTGLDVVADGATGAQADSVGLEIYRRSFDDAFGNVPEVPAIPAGSPLADAVGSGGQGAQLSLSGNPLQSGRYLVRVLNQGSTEIAATVRVDLEYSGATVPVAGGLWEPSVRAGISQGMEYTRAGSNRAVLWYTYNEDGSPAWYLAANAVTDNNIWSADLLRFTNDGTAQAATVVGSVIITMLSESDSILSWTLNGVSGSDRMTPLARTCPEVNGNLESYTGIWFRGSDGLGGASVIANRSSQGQIHYLYDAKGQPRWLLGAGALSATQLPLLQFDGFCPNCDGIVGSQEVGLLDVGFDSTSTGSWTLDYLFEAPVEGGATRTDSIQKLTDTLACEP